VFAKFTWRSRTSDKRLHFRRHVQRVRQKVNNGIDDADDPTTLRRCDVQRADGQG